MDAIRSAHCGPTLMAFLPRLRILFLAAATLICLISNSPQADAQLSSTAGAGATGKDSVKKVASTPSNAVDTANEEPKPSKPLPPPKDAKKLSKEYDIWIDSKNKKLYVDGKVCLREGALEMFGCPKGSKEHESIVSLNTKAFLVHAALLSIQAEVGKPVQFDPVYKPAEGTEIEIEVEWRDKDGKRQTARAQDWIRNFDTHKPMTHPWVFAGSGFWTDERTGKRHYQAEAGDLICVSNFPSATLDLPIKSSQANDGLLFEAFTDRIPPLGTNIRLTLTPKLPKPVEKPETSEKKKSTEKTDSPAKSDSSSKK